MRARVREPRLDAGHKDAQARLRDVRSRPQRERGADAELRGGVAALGREGAGGDGDGCGERAVHRDAATATRRHEAARALWRQLGVERAAGSLARWHVYPPGPRLLRQPREGSDAVLDDLGHDAPEVGAQVHDVIEARRQRCLDVSSESTRGGDGAGSSDVVGDPQRHLFRDVGACHAVAHGVVKQQQHDEVVHLRARARRRHHMPHVVTWRDATQ